MPVITCPDCGREVSTLASSCPHCGRPSPAAGTPSAPLKEETLWHGSPSAIVLVGKVVMIVLTLVIVPLIASYIASSALDFERGMQIRRIGWIVTTVAVLVQIVALLIAYARLRSTTYTVTNQRVVIELGLLSKSVNDIDLRYIDDSQFYQSLTGRMFNIGNVTLVSSDKIQPMYVLRSIRNPRAVRETIRAQAYQVSQRQLFTRAT
jgi:uncharacterized membrane protein YdbT with pleckstrin-like domain